MTNILARAFLAAILPAATALLGGCAAGVRPPIATVPGPDPSAEDVSWVAGPTPEVRSLVLRPAPVGTLRRGDTGPLPLSVGAFLAEMQTDSGSLHHLALLLQLDGDDPSAALDLGRGVLLEIDGAVYVGDAGTQDGGRHIHNGPRGRRLSLSVPIAEADLRLLIQADEVRIRLGGSEALTLPVRDRDRLRLLVERLPGPAAAPPARLVLARASTQ
ncbi:MAG: hypothetical protein RQ751_09635 [Longimicrobiales bacterium]|nr:hypothetical protein [Longimicrobiales bacterium]